MTGAATPCQQDSGEHDDDWIMQALTALFGTGPLLDSEEADDEVLEVIAGLFIREDSEPEFAVQEDTDATLKPDPKVPVPTDSGGKVDRNEHNDDWISQAFVALFGTGPLPDSEEVDDKVLKGIAQLFKIDEAVVLPVDDVILEAIAGLFIRDDLEPEFAVRKDSDETLKPDPKVAVSVKTSGLSFQSTNGLEFISLVPSLPVKIGQLGCSARILQGDMEVRLHNEGRLLLVDEGFLAKVELVNAWPVLHATTFNQAVTALFRQLRVTKIYEDQVMEERDQLRAVLLDTIDGIRERSSVHPVEALNLLAILQKPIGHYSDLCEQLCNSTAISVHLREQAATLHRVEMATERRNRFLARFHVRFPNSSAELRASLKEFCQVVVGNRTDTLLAMAPAYLEQHLKHIPQRVVLKIHDSDVKMFHDMDNVLNREIFQKPLADLAERWIGRVKSFKSGDELVPCVNPVYFTLCKSLEELIVEISDRSDNNPEELLTSGRNGWMPLSSPIKWKSESPLTKCLQREYYFVVRLLKHFDPAIPNTKPFYYKPSRLMLLDAPKATAMDTFLRPFRWLVGQTPQNPLGIDDEFYVWFCLLDDVLHHVLPVSDHNLDMFQQIFKSYVQLVSKATVEQLETIRFITHNTARLVVQTCPLVNSDKARSGEDKQILQSQLDAINRIMLGSDCANYFRDLIDVFSDYWKNRCDIIENIPAKNGLDRMELIKKQLLTIVLDALQKNVSVGHIVDLFRTLNDFLLDLDDVSFDWLIKSLPEKQMKAVLGLELIEPVDNKWTDTANQTYRVCESNKFQKLFTIMLDGATCPRHYVIDVITTLLEYVHSQLQHKCLFHQDQIVSCSVLLSSIRTSLMYLREQADYVSFEMFYDESIKPFGNVVQSSQSLSEFIRRIGHIKESYCYIRKQNEMSISEALKMYDELNTDNNPDLTERLRQAYQQYQDQFEQYMEKPASEELNLDKAETVAKLVKESAVQFCPRLFKQWDAHFKQTDLPKILAGAAAVWSISVSEDVSSTGKYFKPHCIQILCVLRLLGADSDEDGVAMHLAQVLTGQGKSLILALIATVLALTGHEVQLVCYNEYLVKRDADDFEDLYELLDVDDAIGYGTFNDMANAVIAPVVDGQETNLRTLVSDLILSKPGKTKPSKPKAQVKDNTVLLMDEVDVFFTKDYYGSSYRPIAFLTVPGLDKIQEKIWSLVNGYGMRDVSKVKSRIREYISSSSSFKSKFFFDEFLHRRSSYDLIVHNGESFVRRKYTNENLFNEQLTSMIADAIKVVDNKRDWKDFKLTDFGAISYRHRDRFVTSTVSHYKNSFNYFRLKKEKFQTYVNSAYNYGYLIISCGSLSYAMLPKTFPLILGVTGTLTSLNQYEKTAIERLYDIRRSSIMPSFFGCSNVQFNSAINLSVYPTKQFWMAQIFSRAHAAIGAKRAVIVFFYNDSLLEDFRAQYCGQLDRLQILTENTDRDEQEQLIGEAGIAKTVTLATRGMGRGVDYKSSVAVEKNGGVHVIQTFFSLDVKEETQIRGRTARKDNKGSYELILCEGHLKTQKLIASGDDGDKLVTYAKLDAARMDMALKENKDIEEKILKNTGNHLTTLAYLQSFFE